VKLFGLFRFLSRWNRRAVVVFTVLLFCTWVGFFVMGMFPLHYFNAFWYQVPLKLGCAFVLFSVWLTILVSPGMSRQRWPLRETGGRMTAAGGCLLFAAVAVCAGGGPHRLGIRTGGKLGIDLQVIRDLQHSTAVITLARGAEIAELPREQWPASVTRTGPWPFDRQVPSVIRVHPSPAGSPSLSMHYGRGTSDVVVQRDMPELGEPGDYDVVQWANDVWLCRNYAD
jgi:hypothetical protein